MAYVDPAKVLSPKESVRRVRLLYDRGPGEWSVAEVDWNGKERVGIRWNGEEGETGVGNPQSRGHPTWFLLPEELQGAVLKEVRSRLPRDSACAAALALFRAKISRASKRPCCFTSGSGSRDRARVLTTPYPQDSFRGP
jgi:hypothetical protein